MRKTRTILSNEQKTAIKKIWNDRATIKTLANEYNVHEQTIKGILYSWKERKVGAWNKPT